ncbi:hypothetical protein, partial [Acinetobacter baumannii]|uniref:hypothetical protein n=1 Tax=Acinetobacter baumannii TaxID=470 RepID=UPI001BB46B64
FFPLLIHPPVLTSVLAGIPSLCVSVCLSFGFLVEESSQFDNNGGLGTSLGGGYFVRLAVAGALSSDPRQLSGRGILQRRD